VPGEHLRVADTPEQLAGAVLNVVQDPLERQRLSLNGRQRVLSNYDWAQSMKRMDEIIRTVLDRKEMA